MYYPVFKVLAIIQDSIIEHYKVPYKSILLEFCWTCPFYVGLYPITPAHPEIPPKEPLALNID